MSDLADQVVRLALPLVLATLAETVSERAGIVNLALDGMLLAGALAAYLVGAGGGAAALPPALLAALLAGVAAAGLLAAFAVVLRGEPIVVGTALHFLLLGATGILFERWKSGAGVTTFAELGAGRHLPAVATLGVVALVLLVLERTRFGVELSAAGDAPEALRAAGRSPVRARVLALLLSGALAGLAGATLTTVLTGTFVEGMSAGRGFLAISLVLFARWQPIGALFAGIFLAAAFTLEIRASAAGAGRLGGAGVFLLRSLPYLLTIGALALTRGRPERAPGALGRTLKGE